MFNKERPYAGVVLVIEEQKWYAPLTSFKEYSNLKSTYVWLHAIHESGKPEDVTGYLFFRNMIPAPDCAVSLFNFHIKGEKYKDLLDKQHFSLKGESERVKKKAQTFHDLIIKRRVGEDMISKACDFQKMLAACKAYVCP